VAAIIDAGCISAGETLARDLVNYAEAHLFGATTAGASSSKMTWSFPSGIASIRIPTRSRMGIDGTLIEFNGIAPQEEIEAKPEDVRQGKNTEILAAEAWILTR
jgi:C-terminal processing protease CtpA/Prc